MSQRKDAKTSTNNGKRIHHQSNAELRQRVRRSKVSALLNGRLANFSSERLMRLLTALGQDIEIVIKTKQRNQERGRIRVIEEIHA